MTRVSLTEDYDDRSVISKLKKMEDKVAENTSVVHSAEESARQSAQSAQETADRFAGSVGAVVQNANQQINASKAQVDDAKAEVDATVTTVAQAVQIANNASASAQASATTVSTYGTRLTAVEDKARDNKASIDHLDIETQDLYDRDANNVKVSVDHVQNVEGGLTLGGVNRTTDTTIGELNDLIVNANRLIGEIDAKMNAYEHMMRTSGDQNLTGDKTNTDGHFIEYGARAQGFIAKSRWVNSQQTSYNNAMPGFIFKSNDDIELGRIELLSNAGVFMIRAEIMNHDGTRKTVELIRGDN